MRLKSITVQNFRSIAKAHKISLSQSTVLVGANNEGKSNFLLALVVAMQVLSKPHLLRSQRHSLPASIIRDVYEWKRDFPLSLQQATPNGKTVIILEFELDAVELADFKKEVGSKLSGTLPLSIKIGAEHVIDVRVSKRGGGTAALSQKSPAIAQFVARRVSLIHIAAVRTARSAQDVVNELVARELTSLEKNPEYSKLVKDIEQLQKPLLDKVARGVHKTLRTFLPDVKGVAIKTSREDRYRALRAACEIEVDDGTPTLLQYKGDGVKSITALALTHHASSQQHRGHTIVALEEPESHLHPSAIHALRAVIADVSSRQQVVLTTHNPVFIDRLNVAANIIVRDSEARPAKNIAELRNCLGVRASDNLRHARVVLLVEGEEDRISLSALLASANHTLARQLDDGALAIDTLGGATNLSYKLGELRVAMCAAYTFLDYDQAGNDAFQKALSSKLIEEKDVTFATCPGKKESEFEDLVDTSCYATSFRSKFGVDLGAVSKGSLAKQKWSARMGREFLHQGKRWDDATKSQAKRLVAESVAAAPETALRSETRYAFDALVQGLMRMTNEIA